MWQHVVYYQTGTVTPMNPDFNQPVNGNGRYIAPRRYGAVVSRVDLQSSEGSTSKIFDIKWYEPWRGYV